MPVPLCGLSTNTPPGRASPTGPRFRVYFAKGPDFTQPPPLPAGTQNGSRSGLLPAALMSDLLGMKYPSPERDVSLPSKIGEACSPVMAVLGQFQY